MNFTNQYFNDVFTSEDLEIIRTDGSLNKLLDDKFEIINQPYGYRKGMHVESQGLAKVRSMHTSAKAFNIGLAKASNLREMPFCCASCSAEIRVLDSIGIKVYVTHISHENFPPGHYRPSPNVTENLEVFSRYLKITKEFVDEKFPNHNLRNRDVQNAIRKIEDSIKVLDNLQTSLSNNMSN